MEVCKSKVYLEKRDWSFGYWEQKMQVPKLFPSSLLVWRGGGKIWSGGNRMKSEDRRSLNQSGLKALADLGDYGLNMLTRSWYRVLALGCWKTTVLNKWQGQNCKEVKADFGNLLPRPLTSPLHPGRSPPGALEALGAEIGWFVGKGYVYFPTSKGSFLPPPLSPPGRQRCLNLNQKLFVFTSVRGPVKWAWESASPELSLLIRTGQKSQQGPRDMSVGRPSQKRVKSQDQKLLLWE